MLPRSPLPNQPDQARGNPVSDGNVRPLRAALEGDNLANGLLCELRNGVFDAALHSAVLPFVVRVLQRRSPPDVLRIAAQAIAAAMGRLMVGVRRRTVSAFAYDTVSPVGSTVSFDAAVSRREFAERPIQALVSTERKGCFNEAGKVAISGAASQRIAVVTPPRIVPVAPFVPALSRPSAAFDRASRRHGLLVNKSGRALNEMFCLKGAS